MPDGNNQNLENSGALPAGRPPLEQRLAQFQEQEVAWKLYNGGCPLSADIAQTLELLKQNVRPYNEDMPVRVIAALQTYLKPGQTIEDVWMQKVAEGANFVGVENGEFSFYRGEEKLPTNNKPMEYSVAPAVMRYREVEKSQIRDAARLARQQMINELRTKNDQGTNV